MSQLLPTEDQIRRRAYELYVQSGCQHGHDLDHWLQAEYELIQLPTSKIETLPPPKPRRGRVPRRSIIHVVQAALLTGSIILFH